MENWKILATSDLHGCLPDIKEEFDVLFICGDICPVSNHKVSYQDEWVKTTFVNWVKALPFKDEESRVVLIPGNHDFIFERWEKSSYEKLTELTHGRLIALCNENISIGKGESSIRVFGTPYCKQFYDWAFMIPDKDKMRAKYSQCEEGVDFFLTHDSPTLGDLGMINEGWSNGTDAGNEILSEVILEKRPRVVLSGHIHSGNHEWHEEKGIMMTNVSYVNEGYYPVNNLVVMEYNPWERKVVGTEKKEVRCLECY